MTIGERIKSLRIKENLSQADLGKIVSVSDKAVSTWESGAKIPRMGAIEKLASHFGVTKSYLIDGETKKEESTLTEKEQILLNLIRQMSDSQIDNLISFLESK